MFDQPDLAPAEARPAAGRLDRLSDHSRAALAGLFVTFLWSTSWVLIKFGLEEVPAITFAGLRYSLAFLALLPLAWRRGRLAPLRALPGRAWLQLLALGLILYTLTQGAQFLGLFYLPAITTNLLLSFTSILVALAAIRLLAERPTGGQWAGALLYLAGALLYFFPLSVPAGQALGYAIVAGGVLANAAAALLGRHVNRSLGLPALSVTVASMGIGGLALLAAGLLGQGLPPLSPLNWAIILWLALVNSAFAFTLWNRSLRVLTALEASVINNTMMIQIPILAWLFLGERPLPQQWLGMLLAAAGVFWVQLAWRRP
ncbi:MAG: DMT family transporter [Candidatus Promineifilaceae bacterium]